MPPPLPLPLSSSGNLNSFSRHSFSRRPAVKVTLKTFQIVLDPPPTSMSGYGNKNPPWGRNPGGMGGMGPPHLGMFDQNVGGGGMLQQGIPLQQQGMGLAGMAPQGMAPVQGQVTGISYPAPRGVAPGGFLPNILQQQQAAMSVMGNVQTSQQVLDIIHETLQTFIG